MASNLPSSVVGGCVVDVGSCLQALVCPFQSLLPKHQLCIMPTTDCVRIFVVVVVFKFYLFIFGCAGSSLLRVGFL